MLPDKNLQHITSVTHQGRILLFGIDPARAIYYCAKLEPPGESVTGYSLTPANLYRLKQALRMKAPPLDVGARLDPLVGQKFADKDTYLAAVIEKLGVDDTRKCEADLLEHAKIADPIHWTSWILLTLPNEEDDTSVIERERAEGIDGLARSVYRSHKSSAIAPIQVLSDGEHLHLFRQSEAGTLLVDRFAFDSEASRLTRKLEVRFKRSKKRHEPLRSTSVKDLDSLDFRDTDGGFFYEPSIELRLAGTIEGGRFAVVLTPTHERDRHRWHIFTWDSAAKLLRSTTLARSAESLFDLRDWTAVEGTPEEPVYRRIPGIVRHAVALRDAHGQALEPRGGISAVVHDLQREIEGDDGEKHWLKVERRVLVTVPTSTRSSLVNIAAGKPTAASSEWSSDHAASRANPVVSPGSGGWSPRGEPELHWWQVDLGERQPISCIELVTRQDGDQPETRRNFAIWLANRPDMSDHVVVGQQGDVPLPVQATFTAEVPGPAYYRYIRVVKTVSEYFFIGELRVLADPHGKIAALSFGLHGDGSLAPIDPAHHDRLLLEHNQEVELPANSLDRLETCRDHIREAPPLVTRSGLVFDGGEQIIDTRDAPALADTSFTIELWARCRRLGNTEVFLGQGVSGVDSALHLGFRGGGFFFAFGANDLDAPLGQDREWHHWACVSHQGGLRQIFRDGVKVAEDTPARPFKGTGRLWLGGAFGYGYDGELADVRVWRRARTGAEINETMNHRLTGRELGLVAHWPLDAIVDRQVFNTVGQVPGLVKGGVYRTGRVLARTLADGYNLVDRYSNPALVPVAERATYIESFELKSASEGPPFDIVFWGETVRGERTAPVGVPAQFERLPDGWVRVTARFTTPQGMTRLRTLEFTPAGGTWNPLEIRNHRLARLHGTVTESSHAEAAALTELAPEFAALLKVEQTLGALESQEVELARKLSPIDKSLAGGVQALQTLVAKNQELADKAESRARQLEMELRHLEGHIGRFSTIALHTSHSTFSRYLRVDGTEVDARATEPGPWEEFTIVSLDRPCVHYGDNVGLLAHSARYLSPNGVKVTTTDSPYLNWWIFNPDNHDDLGPIPVGAKVALMGHGGCLTYDADSTSHTHGAVWCGGAPEWEHTRFRVEQSLEGPEVAAARERHDDARDKLDRCNRELAFARDVLANYQNLSIMRDNLQAQLVALQGQISAAITEHLAATQAIDDATMSMPQLSPLARPLTVQGALLGFARTHASPTAIDSLEGAVHLYFAGTEGRLRRCTYDALGQRWRADTLGACLRFRGQGDHVEIPHRSAFTARAFTIELWARWRGSGTDTHFLTARGIEELEIHTGGAVPDGLRFIPVPGVHIDSEPGVLRSGEWFHVACVYAGHASTAEIYLNGKLVTLRRSGGEATKQPSDRPLRLGLRGDGSLPLAGEMAEVRLWNVVLTRDEIAAQMHFRLSGHEPGLVGYWPLREGAGVVARDVCARGAPANIKDGSIKGPTWYPSTAPIGRPKAGLPTISGAPLAGEYSTLEGKEGQKEALLRRFIAWPREGGAEVLHGQRVDTLELRWLGNIQMKPTLVGYIEGAPPVPSENLTIKDDYNGASSVEFKVTDESSSTFTHDVVTEFGKSVEESFGINYSGTTMAIDWLMRAVVKLQASVGGHVVHQNSSTNSASTITSERLALKGEREEVVRLPQIGRRFIPKNVGYASVVSTLADMFVMRMRGNKRMVGFQISEVEGVPPDVNVITFMLNPAYTMNGSLDGQVGTSAADPRFYGHIPEARGQHGASVPASYYRLAEAYDLKRAIDRANSGAAAVAINRKSDLITPTGQANDAENETKLADVVGRTPMRSIANTYVWDGDGGLRVESQSFATEWTNVIGGGWSFGAGVGYELKLTVGVTAELSKMASFSIRHTMTTTTVGSRAIELNVTVDGENQGITDNRDRPLVPGEKVDRYRFMSFALEPATAHFDDFFARVVDPEWLAGNSAEAYALRQIDRSKKNATWRVLHRVTYVERPK